MPMTPAQTAARERLIARLRRWRDDIRLDLASTEHWNAQHPDEEPLSFDPDGVLASIADAIDRFLEQDLGHGPIRPFLTLEMLAHLKAETGPRM